MVIFPIGEGTAKHNAISEFDNSDYDALWDGRGDIAMHKPNGDIPRDPVTFPTIANY